jgi:hypothetical protein
MLGYEVMRSLMSSKGMALFLGLWDRSWPWEFLDRIYEEKLDLVGQPALGMVARSW